MGKKGLCMRKGEIFPLLILKKIGSPHHRILVKSIPHENSHPPDSRRPNASLYLFFSSTPRVGVEPPYNPTGPFCAQQGGDRRRRQDAARSSNRPLRGKPHHGNSGGRVHRRPGKGRRGTGPEAGEGGGGILGETRYLGDSPRGEELRQHAPRRHE